MSSCLLGEQVKSPGCGIRGIPRYAGDGQPADRSERGRCAARVLAAFPLLPAQDEARLTDAGLREAFTERIFAHARLRELFAGRRPAGPPGGVSPCAGSGSRSAGRTAP